MLSGDEIGEGSGWKGDTREGVRGWAKADGWVGTMEEYWMDEGAKGRESLQVSVRRREEKIRRERRERRK